MKDNRALEGLSGYAVEFRYDPEFWPGRDTAADALVLAERVRTVVVGFLPLLER